MILAWKGSVAAEAASPAARIIVVGGDAVVGHALELLLRGSGYDARSEALSTFDAKGAPLDSELILLAPGLDKRGRGTVLASVYDARRGRNLPVVELVPAMAVWPGDGHAFLPWPCRMEDLERVVEVALRGKGRHVGRVRTNPEERSIGHDHGYRPRR